MDYEIKDEIKKLTFWNELSEVEKLQLENFVESAMEYAKNK